MLRGVRELLTVFSGVGVTTVVDCVESCQCDGRC